MKIRKTTFLLFAGILQLCVAFAQQSPSKESSTWQDLGFSLLSKDFSTDKIPLFEGLNKSRGTWSFEGKTIDGKATHPLKGSLHIIGSPKSGMLPSWHMALSWVANDEENAVKYAIMASPRPTGFDLMLFRVGPTRNLREGITNTKPQPSMFRGQWNLENRTITWTRSNLPARLKKQSKKDDVSEPSQSFEMVVASDGKISIQNSKNASQMQVVSGKAIVRTAKAPEEPVTLNGKYNFKTVEEIADRRIRPTLPPQATEISLLSTRGGHFARYRVEEDHFIEFLDKLWEAKKNSSAHKRDLMHGEGEPVNRERMAKRFKVAGWEPLENSVSYFSPSKPSGAMTTYYYDREAGIAYHDTGYW